MDKNHKTCLALVRVAHSSHKATKRSNFSFSLWLRVLSDWKERARDRFRGLFVQDFARHEPHGVGDRAVLLVRHNLQSFVFPEVHELRDKACWGLSLEIFASEEKTPKKTGPTIAGPV